MVKWINGHIKNRLFNKIIIFYSFITIFFLTSLAFLAIYIINDNKTNEVMNANASMVDEAYYILNNKYTAAQNIENNLYENSLTKEAVLTFLKIGNPEFGRYSLDSYFNNDISHFSNLKSYLISSIGQDRDIDSIVLYSTTKEFIYYFDRNSNSHYYNNETPNFISYKNEIDKYPLHRNTVLATNLSVRESSTNTFSLILDITDDLSLRTIGKLIINYNKNSIYNSYFDGTSSIDAGHIVLLTANDILFDSTNEYYETIAPKLRTIRTTHNYSERVMLNTPSYVKSIRHEDIHVNILGIIPQKIITNNVKPTILLIIIAGIVCILAIISLTFLFTTSYSNRLHKITSAIKNVRKGDLSVRIKTNNKKDELTEIGNNFNRMCDDLNDYIEKVYIYQVKQKSAELKSLQAQINPHFLYNTLESIRMRAAVRGAIDVSEMIYILASFFKNSLKTDTITTIEQEIEHCKLYLKLFQIRYSNKLSVNFNIDETILSYSILKLSLQPIVENYIVHGIDLDSNDNKVTITGRLNNDNIIIDIEDNGCGIDTETLNKIKQALDNKLNPKSIGIFNVHERLKIVYGNAYGLLIDSEENIGTKVTLSIPAKKKGDVNNV